MNSRERLLRVLNGQKADRMPVTIFIGDTDIEYGLADGIIEKKTGDALRDVISFHDLLGIDIMLRLSTRIYEPIAFDIDSENWENIWEMQEDKRILTHRIITPEGEIKETFNLEGEHLNGNYKSEWMKLRNIRVEAFIKTADDLIIIKKYRPEIPNFDFGFIKEAKKRLGNRGIVLPRVPSSVFNYACSLRNMEELLVDPYLDIEFYRELMEYCTSDVVCVGSQIAAGGGDAVRVIGNIASGDMVSPDFYREYIYNYEKRYIDALAKNGSKVLFHNCGKCANLLEVYRDLLDGHMLESFSSPSSGGDIGSLRKAREALGEKVIMIGNLDQVHLLKNGTQQEITSSVEKIIEEMRDDKGFIFSTSDSLTPDTPAENIRIAVDVALKSAEKYSYAMNELPAMPDWMLRGVIPDGRTARLISDLGVCTPGEALAARHTKGHWKVLSYQTADLAKRIKPPGFEDLTDSPPAWWKGGRAHFGTYQPGEISGRSLQALPRSNAPEVVLPLRAEGWHAIFIGIAGLEDIDGGQAGIRFKLTGDESFQLHGIRAAGKSGNAEQWGPSGPPEHLIEEIFLKCADLTGRNLHLAQQSTGEAKPADIYYVKLLPLTESEIQSIAQIPQQGATRRLIGTFDGLGSLGDRQPTTKAELLEIFEPFRQSDFGTIWWGIGIADIVNYRTSVGSTCGEHQTDAVHPRNLEANIDASVQGLIRNGIDISRAVVEASHAVGCDIQAYLRPAAWVRPEPMSDSWCSTFFEAHPEWRCRDRNGVEAPRMSFAVPEVRRHLIDLFTEVLDAGFDGINIAYNRGMPLILWEDAFCESFQAAHGVDARQVAEDDPRLYELRGDFMTQWMREIRALLDAHPQRQSLKRHLKLSAILFATEADNRRFGLDAERWVREGLIDQIGIAQAGPWYISAEPIDLDWYRRITKGKNVTLHPMILSWVIPNALQIPALLQKAVKWHDEGADSMLVWDCDIKSVDGATWPTISRLGHISEMRGLANAAPPTPKQPQVVNALGQIPPSRWTRWAGY
jgi:uroporphyrinogen-III decarboxylase